jgi:hypothetical protein
VSADFRRWSSSARSFSASVIRILPESDHPVLTSSSPQFVGGSRPHIRRRAASVRVVGPYAVRRIQPTTFGRLRRSACERRRGSRSRTPIVASDYPALLGPETSSALDEVLRASRLLDTPRHNLHIVTSVLGGA